VTTDAYRGMPPFGAVGSLPLARLAETGFAFSGAGGLRLVPPPGPLGFTLALHGARTIARHSRCGAMGVTFGMTLYPLDRRRAAPAAH